MSSPRQKLLDSMTREQMVRYLQWRFDQADALWRDVNADAKYWNEVVADNTDQKPIAVSEVRERDMAVASTAPAEIPF